MRESRLQYVIPRGVELGTEMRWLEGSWRVGVLLIGCRDSARNPCSEIFVCRSERFAANQNLLTEGVKSCTLASVST